MENFIICAVYVFATLQSITLRKKCPYSELFWSASPYSVRMQENADQNNSEYGHFSRSVTWYVEFATTNLFMQNSFWFQGDG